MEAQHALARWADGDLVNTYGELFTADSAADLPRFAGPPGTERDVAERYRRFCDLLAPLHLQPVEVKLTQRFAWELRLQDGLLLELGRDGGKEGADDRLARFVRVYPETLARYGRKFEYVDLRYPNGFALRVPDVPGFLKGAEHPQPGADGPAGADRAQPGTEDPAGAGRARSQDIGRSATHARGTRPA